MSFWLSLRKMNLSSGIVTMTKNLELRSWEDISEVNQLLNEHNYQIDLCICIYIIAALKTHQLSFFI